MTLHRRLARFRQRLVRDDGASLIELAAATFVLGIVSLVFTQALASLQKTMNDEEYRSTNNNQARLVLTEIDREVRSGNILYNPAVDDPTGMRLRIYTQSNGVPYKCVQYRIQGTQLQRRVRDPGYGLAWPSTWRVVAENVVNVQYNVPAFKLDPDTSKGGRTLIVTLWVNRTSSASAIEKVAMSVTGRNTSFQYPTEVCNPYVP